MPGKFLQKAQCLKLQLIKAKRVVPGRHRIGLSGWLHLRNLYAGTARQSTSRRTSTSRIRFIARQSYLNFALGLSTRLPGSLARSKIRGLTVSRQVCTPSTPISPRPRSAIMASFIPQWRQLHDESGFWSVEDCRPDAKWLTGRYTWSGRAFVGLVTK